VSDFKVGDIVVLTAGSMRMAIETVKADLVSTVWCNEGVIGRDSFPKVLLKKWEYREEERSGRSSPRPSDRFDDKKSDRFRKPRGTKRANENLDNNEESKPRGKMGWDGKPREKKFFRKD
jgi:hypothetical protein